MNTIITFLSSIKMPFTRMGDDFYTLYMYSGDDHILNNISNLLFNQMQDVPGNVNLL